MSLKSSYYLGRGLLQVENLAYIELALSLSLGLHASPISIHYIKSEQSLGIWESLLITLDGPAESARFPRGSGDRAWERKSWWDPREKHSNFKHGIFQGTESFHMYIERIWHCVLFEPWKVVVWSWAESLCLRWSPASAAPARTTQNGTKLRRWLTRHFFPFFLQE